MHPLFTFCIAASLIFLPGCSGDNRAASVYDITLISEISADRTKAFNEGNAKAISVHFADDALLMAPGKPVVSGSRQVETYYQSIFDKYTAKLESHYEEVEVSGNLAYGRGEARVILISKKDGDTSYSVAKYLNILKKQGGVWKTTHDIWNDNE